MPKISPSTLSATVQTNTRSSSKNLKNILLKFVREMIFGSGSFIQRKKVMLNLVPVLMKKELIMMKRQLEN